MRPGRFIFASPAAAEKIFKQRRSRRKTLRTFARREWAVGLGIFLAWATLFVTVAEDSAGSRTNAPVNRTQLDPDYQVGNWIWDSETRDEQTCRFWRRVDIPANESVARAELTITADNAYHVFVDGQEIGQGVIWYNLTEYDLTLILGTGPHILAVECFNQYQRAGLAAGLRIELRDGKTIEVPTDSDWKIVPNTERHWKTRRTANPRWPAAVVEAKYREWTLWQGRKVQIFRTPPVLPLTTGFWQRGWFRDLIFSVCGILAALCLWLAGKLAIYSRAQQVVRRERARIARDIHDDLTAGLTQLALFGEVAQSELPEGSEARRQVAKVCEKARGLSQAMNEVIWMVNSRRDTFPDFSSYLCKHAETFLEATPIRCRFDVDEEIPELPCDLGVRRNLFLGVKEALNNAVRYSGASELLLRIHWREQQIVVSIEDNGRGFDLALAAHQGNGLSNMVTRATEAGGVCRIVSRPGAGCRVEFVVPLARATGGQLKLWKRRPSENLRIPKA